MAREFELREAGTGKLLGSVQTLEDCTPGSLVLAFRQDRMQVQSAPGKSPPPDAVPPADQAQGRRKKR